MQVSRGKNFPHPSLNSDMSFLLPPSTGAGTLKEVQAGPRTPLGVSLILIIDSATIMLGCFGDVYPNNLPAVQGNGSILFHHTMDGSTLGLCVPLSMWN